MIDIWISIIIAGIILFVTPVIKYMITKKYNNICISVFFIGSALLTIGICGFIGSILKMAYTIISNYYIG